MSPANRQLVLPSSHRYLAHRWLDRLVCPDAQQPRWRRTDVEDPIARYDVQCPNAEAVVIELDLSQAPPAAPEPLRLLTVDGYEHLEAAIEQNERKNRHAALAHLDAALEHEPDEPLYRVARLSILYEQGSLLEVLIESDALLEKHSAPVAWKFQALAARDLGLGPKLLQSLDGLLASTPPSDPLFAEAVCARGLIHSDDPKRLDLAVSDLEAGCRMGQPSCCDRLAKERKAEKAARPTPEPARSLTSPTEGGRKASESHEALENHEP